jgi:siroheme synthase-like protein
MFLNVNGKRCIVIGGGTVALRKAKSLLEYKAVVEVISPDICGEINKLANKGQIKVTRRPYQEGDLQGALLAIAATDDRTINTHVSEEAQKSGVLINAVDDPQNSNFIVPACLHRGDLTIAISTGGRSPALARKIRLKLEKDFGEEYAPLAVLIDEIRDKIKQQGIKINGDVWEESLDLDLLIDLIRKGEIEKARITLFDSLKSQKKG